MAGDNQANAETLAATREVDVAVLQDDMVCIDGNPTSVWTRR